MPLFPPVIRQTLPVISAIFSKLHEVGLLLIRLKVGIVLWSEEVLSRLDWFDLTADGIVMSLEVITERVKR